MPLNRFIFFKISLVKWPGLQLSPGPAALAQCAEGQRPGAGCGLHPWGNSPVSRMCKSIYILYKYIIII